MRYNKKAGSYKKNKVILIKAGRSEGRLPHALLALAANLDDEVLIIDEATPQLIIKHKDDINNAICVGISTITGTYIKDSLDVAKSIRSINPDVPLVWGGWHPSLKPEQTLKNKYVDKVVVGQGEQAFRDVVENIKNGNKVEDIITYEYKPKEDFPYYNLDMINNLEQYITPMLSPRTITLYTSQGCPFGCKFCSIDSLYGKKHSAWPIEYVVSLTEFLVRKYNIDGVRFDDDNFFIGKKRALDFAEQILQRNIQFVWSGLARADLLCNLNKEEWEILDRSGCKRLMVGAESGATQTLDILDKKISPEMILDVGHLCSKYRITPSISMMVGVPGEKKEHIEETFKLIDVWKSKFPASELQLYLYTPYPGTQLFDQSLEMGFKEPQYLEEWGEFYLNVSTVPWVDQALVERVRQYQKILPNFRDFSLKFPKKFRFMPKIYYQRSRYYLPIVISGFIKSNDRKSYMQGFLKRMILNKV